MVRQAALRLQGINKRLGNFHLKDLSLEIGPGEYFVLLGPTGAGKTLLLEIIAGIHPVDTGEIWLGGVNLTHLPPEKRRCGFVYQDYALFPHLTVRKNIAFGLKVNRVPAPEAEKRVEEMAALLGITHLLSRFPRTLSGGEQQRVALARALVVKPQVLLLDEPLAALDPRTKEALQRELQRLHRATGTLTVHVTHDFEEAFFLADRLGIIDHGELLQVGSPQEIFSRPSSARVAAFLGTENIYRSEVIYTNGKAFVRLGQALLEVETSLRGPVGISIRPEAIILSSRPQSRNCLAARVLTVHRRGLFLKVAVEAAGEKLTVLVPPREAESFAQARDGRVYCCIPPAAINTFPS